MTRSAGGTEPSAPTRADLPFATFDDCRADWGAGATLLLRLDLNAPVEGGVVRDTLRFARHAETVAACTAAGYRTVCLAHQGRPGRDTYVSLAQHAEILEDHLADRGIGESPPVAFCPATHENRAVEAIESLDPGDVLLLENVRFADDELAERSPAEHADSAFVRSLAGPADAFVNDAYSAAHRAHASIVGFPQVLPAYGGPVMTDEYAYNTSIRERTFEGPVAMALGGVKADDLVDVMGALDDRVDHFLLGGVVGELFLRAAGHDVGYDVPDPDAAGVEAVEEQPPQESDGEAPMTDLFDAQWTDLADRIATIRAEATATIHLPSDLAYADPDGSRAEVAVADVRKERPFLDVGRDTAAAYADVVRASEATFVKGALGVFEDERFANGTRSLLEAIAESDGYAVVGGGDTAGAIDRFGIDEAAFDHVSIAGGAYVAALAGHSLPAVEALIDGRPE